MKRHLILLTILLFAALTSLAQTSLPTNLKGVTIFSNGAQVTREKNVALNAGEQTVSFTGLSPYLDRNSLQVKAKGSVTVLGVSQRYIRPDSTMLSERLKAASRDIDVASRRLSELQAQPSSHSYRWLRPTATSEAVPLSLLSTTSSCSTNTTMRR